MNPIDGDAVSRLDAAVSELKTRLSSAPRIISDAGPIPLRSGEFIWRRMPSQEQMERATAEQLRESVAAHQWAEAASLQQIAELERAVADLKTEIALLRGQEAWLLSTNEDLIDRLSAAREEKRRQCDAMSDMYRELAQLRQALAEAEEASARGRHEANEAERQRDDGAALSTFLAEQLSQLRLENHRLRASLEDYEARTECIRRRERIVIEALLSNGHTRRIGEILCAAKVITPEQLDDAITTQNASGGRMMGAILVECGHTGEEEVAQAVACQCKVYLIRLGDTAVDLLSARCLGPDFCRLHACMPVRATPDRVFVAMANPRDTSAIESVEAALGRRVEPIMATPSDLAATIDRVFEN